ncbi:MAG: histidine kinase [Anaerolineaceae bacterium]|nr:histidine kinase [Anaerolineaceae bacterium]
MKNKRSYSLTKLISGAFLTLFVVMVVLACVFSFYFFKSTFQRTISIYQSSAENDASAVSDLLDSARHQLDWIVSELKNSSIESETDSYDRLIRYESLTNSINSTLRVSEILDAILILPRNTDLLIEAHSMPEDRFLAFVNSYSGHVIPSSAYPLLFPNDNTGEKTHLVLYSQVKKLNTNALSSITIATVYVSIPTEKLITTASSENRHILCYERGSSLSPVISDGFEDGFDITSFDLSNIERSYIRFGSRAYFLINMAVPDSNFHLLTLIPLSDLFGKLWHLIIIVAAFIIALLLLTLFGIRFVLERMHAPMNSLVKDIQTVVAGNENFRLPGSPAQEVTEISNSVNQMLDELQKRNALIQETRENIRELQLLHKESQLQALQSQINPHFLYNTLGCIRSLAMKNQVAQISDILNSIIMIYRYSASQSSTSTIRDEFSCCEHYANIMKYRFGNRYIFRLQMEPGLEGVQVPRMILQPLIENSVNHGYSEAAGNGIIEVFACRSQEDFITLSVKDYGRGIASADLAKLCEQIRGEQLPDDQNEHIGLRNVHQRIRRSFGEPYGMKIESEKGVFTEVLITIPFQEGGKVE